MLASFGTTDFLVKQSIVPVVAWVDGAKSIRCIGTGFIVSCSGYLVTATHVLLDPVDNRYGNVKPSNQAMAFGPDLHMGILIPISPATGNKGFQFVEFEKAWYWGQWRESPLFDKDPALDSLTDVAICKLPLKSNKGAYQPLNLSLNPFHQGDIAYAIGYAMMKDIPIKEDGAMVIVDHQLDIFVSIGDVIDIYPLNHASNKESSTPGPCFNFQARIPGGMSGGPIFGAQGCVVRGVISKSLSGEKHASGCMMGPVMTLPFSDQVSFQTLMNQGTEGIAVVSGQGL